MKVEDGTVYGMLYRNKKFYASLRDANRFAVFDYPPSPSNREVRPETFNGACFCCFNLRGEILVADCYDSQIQVLQVEKYSQTSCRCFLNQELSFENFKLAICQ